MEVSQERREFCRDSARFLGGVALASVLPSLAFANAKIPTVTLNNGVKMPLLGLGTLKIGNDAEVQRAIEEALEL